MIKRGDKGGYEFSFAWLFAVVVGAFLIFLAVYIATQLVGTERFKAETYRGKEIGILLNPVETNLESAKFVTLSVPDETIIFNNCTNRGVFGSQDIAVKIKSGIGKEWGDEPGVQSSFHNKYLFSAPEVYGEKDFYLLSKPFKFPFKVADILILWSDNEKYCFVFDNPAYGEEIRKELDELNPEADLGPGEIKLIVGNANVNLCPENSKKVCFGFTGGCDVYAKVEADGGSVKYLDKNEVVYYVNSLDANDKYALLYGAIFSGSINEYECQSKRLIKGRASELADLYARKARYLYKIDNCAGTAIQSSLTNYKTTAPYFDGKNWDAILQRAEEVRNGNPASCRLF